MGISIVIMILVIFTWLTYFNSILTAIAPSIRGGEEKVRSDEDRPLLETIREGAATLYGTLGGFLEKIKQAITTPKSDFIEPAP